MLENKETVSLIPRLFRIQFLQAIKNRYIKKWKQGGPGKKIKFFIIAKISLILVCVESVTTWQATNYLRSSLKWKCDEHEEGL